MKTTYTIAEIGQAHDGSLEMAHAYIDALAGTGVKAIKFQMHIAEAESSVHEPFRVKFLRTNRTRMEYWKHMEFSEEEWHGLKAHCEEKGLVFLATPSSLEAAEKLGRMGVAAFKVGSGDTSNLLLLERLAATGKDIMLSSGMSTMQELDTAIKLLKTRVQGIALFQCTSVYPTRPEQWGLNMISVLKERYGIPVGFSDHSGDIYAGLAAVALGARLLEFHVVFDKRMAGPDAPSSLTVDQVTALIRGVKQLDKAVSIDKNNQDHLGETRMIFEKSLAVNKSLEEGHVVAITDLETKKPRGMGISPADFRKVIGKRLARPLKKWDFLNEADLV